jgi:hypothetical protein
MSGISFGTLWTLLVAWPVDEQPVFNVLVLMLFVSIHFGLWMGLVCGFLLKSKMVTIEFLEPEEFLRRLDKALLKLRYRSINRSGSCMTYKPSFALWPVDSTRISVQISDDCATILGPHVHVSKLERKLNK